MPPPGEPLGDPIREPSLMARLSKSVKFCGLSLNLSGSALLHRCGLLFCAGLLLIGLMLLLHPPPPPGDLGGDFGVMGLRLVGGDVTVAGDCVRDGEAGGTHWAGSRSED